MPGSNGRRPTIADVARRAGVSTATVSNVMNERGRVGEQSRRRVRRAADAMGFRPDRLARGLRAGRTHVIGLLLGNIANPFYTEIAAGVVDGAARVGYHVFVGHTAADPVLQRNEAQALRDHRCDGLIFTAIVRADRPLLDELLRGGVPIVQVERRLPGLGADYVGIDDRAAGREIAGHLAQLGHRAIAIISGPHSSTASHERYLGMREGIRAAGLPLRRAHMQESELTREGGHAAARRLLAARPLPTAVACGNDMIALGAIDALIDHGLRIPGDIAVAGFDDMPFASSRLINLTTVQQPLQQLGSAAVELLLARLHDPGRAPVRMVLPHRLVVRTSSGSPVLRLPG